MTRLFFIWFFFIGISVYAIDNVNHDFQLWTHLTATTKINKCYSWNFELTNRWDNNATRFYYSYVQALFNWKINKYWTIAPGYRFGYRKKSRSDNTTWWRPESLPMIDITKFWFWKKYTLSDRNRFEYSSFSRHWTYRNRILISYKAEYSPYITNEFFFKKGNDYTQNRFGIGIKKELCHSFSGNIYYMLRNKKRINSWLTQHILGIQLNRDF